MKRTCASALLLLFLTSAIFGQESFTKRPIAALETAHAPIIDGDLSDEIWKTAPKAETFVDRTTNAIVPDQTIAFVAYDQNYIYIAFHCIDSQPDKVEARETIRDSKYAVQQSDSPNKEDNVTVALDPYYTRKPEDLSVFSVNALGTPSAQIAGGRGGKLEWKGTWDSAAKRVADGYTVEMRIPWAMLNYPSSKNAITMGIGFYRYQYHNKLESLWSNVGPHSFTELEGLWTGVKVPKAKFHPRLSVLPYVLPGVKDDRLTFRSGVDARMTVTPDLTAVASLNPDFNTIEGAVEGIAFSRAERYVPERRPFFLEGQSYFSPGTHFNDIGAFFYPRRVPNFDLGTKIYGKLSPEDSIGILNTITFGDRMDSVFSYRRSLSETSDAGIFLSNKSAAIDHNSVAVVDEHARVGNFGIESQFGKTWGPGAGGGAVVLSGNYQQGTNVSLLQYHSISNAFQISDGYIPYKGYRGLYGFTDFNSNWRHGFWRSYDYGVYGLAWDHMDQSRYQRSAGIFASMTARSDWRTGFSYDYALVDNTLDDTVTISFTNGVSNRFRQYGFNLQTGTLASQPATFIAPTASFRLFKRLDLAYAGSILNLQGVTRQHILTAGYDLSPTRSIGGRLVVQDQDTNWYLSYRSSGGRGTDLYFIVGDPNSKRFSRQVQLKLIFSF